MARPVLAGAPAQKSEAFTPIRFLYTYLHEAIRRELSSLTALLSELCDGSRGDWPKVLRRYAFLKNVYKYHSSAEDEVSWLVLSKEGHHSSRAGS